MLYLYLKGEVFGPFSKKMETSTGWLFVECHLKNMKVKCLIIAVIGWKTKCLELPISLCCDLYLEDCLAKHWIFIDSICIFFTYIWYIGMPLSLCESIDVGIFFSDSCWAIQKIPGKPPEKERKKKQLYARSKK